MAPNGPGSKAEREKLRRTMQAQGCTSQQIASEMARCWGFRPRQAWRHAYGWTQGEVAARYNQLLGDPKAPMTDKRISDYEAWPVGGVKPTVRVLFMLAAIYGTDGVQLIDSLDRHHLSKHDLIALEKKHLDQFATQITADEPVSLKPGSTLSRVSSITTASVRDKPPDTLADLVALAAKESLDHAENAQGHAMPEVTLDEMTAEVERLAAEKLRTSSRLILPDLVRARNQIYRLMEYRQYPKQSEHLYYLASITCALLAGTSSSVGFQEAAIDQARASWAYAEIIGHNQLRFYSRIRLSGFVEQGNRPERALKLAQSAIPWATEPLSRASLFNSIALYSARTARVEQAKSALVQAFEAHEESTGDSAFFDHLGGAFSYPRAKLLQVATKTLLELGDVEKAEVNASEAISLYTSGPAEKRAPGNESAARIDLGHARLLKGDAEGAVDSLQSVFQLAARGKPTWVVKRLIGFQLTLRQHRIATSTLGRQLEQDIEDFLDDANG